MMMFTGNAETPRTIDISTSNRRPPMRIDKATQSGLKQPCCRNDQPKITAKNNVFTK